MPISKKKRNSSRSKVALIKDMKGQTQRAQGEQLQQLKITIARGLYIPPKPKKQPVWRRNVN